MKKLFEDFIPSKEVITFIFSSLVTFLLLKKIFTVENLQQKEIETFKNLLIKKFDLSQVIIENIIDKTLIGGFVFIFNNTKYDYSLKNNLQHISEMFN